MTILALDTTMRACSAAVLRGMDADARLFRVYEDRDRGHAEAIIPMVETVMREAQTGYDAIERIAVTLGPGTFTGVRVGVAAARGLALATGAQTVGFTSLETIAARARHEAPDAEGLVAVAADARRGQVYFAVFGADGAIVCDQAALTPAEAAGLLPVSGEVVLAGSGAALVAEAAQSRGHADVLCLEGLQPDAAVVAKMAQQGAGVVGPVSPVYLRAPDAKPQAHTAVPRL